MKPPPACLLLIIHASAEDRHFYRHNLQSGSEYSNTILEASSGQQGLQLWHQYRPDAVLMAHNLPDMDSLEFLGNLNTSPEVGHWPVIVLVDQGNEAIATQALQAGAQDWLLTAQLTPEYLQRAVNQVIETGQLRAQLQQRIEGERILAQILEKIQQTFDLDDILQTIAEQVRQFLQTDRVVVWRLEPDGQGQVVAESVGPEWQSLRIDRRIDPQLDPMEWPQQFQVKANFMLPLQSRRDWGGLMVHHCAAERSWCPTEIDWLQKLAVPIGIALRQADLYQQAQQEVAERQQAKAELRDSEERYMTLTRVSPVGIFRTDPSGDCLYANDRWCELAGRSLEQVKGKGWIDAIHPDDRHRVVAEWYQAATSNLAFSSEYRFQTPAGTICWVVGQAIAERDDWGNIIGYVGAITDISDRKQAEQALKNSEERLRVALEASRMGTWDWNLHTGLIQWSDNLEAMFGLEAGQFDGSFQMFADRIHPDDRDHVIAAIHQAIATGDHYNIEFRIAYPNGRVRWTLSQGKVFYDEAGQPIRMVGNDLDITDRKRTEETLRQSEEFKNRLLSSSPDCIKVLDTDGRLLYINTGGICLLEIDDLTPYLNAEWKSFWQGRGREAAEAAVSLSKTGQSSRFQGFCATAKGTPKWWDVVITPIPNAAGEIAQILVTSRDITEYRQIEEALRESEERFRTLADNMSQLAWMADRAGWIFWYNQRWFDYTGTTLAEMQGWGWQQVHHPDHVDRVVQYIRHCFESGQVWEDTFPLRGRDGQYRWFLSRAIPIRDEQNQIVCWFGTNTDIDDRKQMEEALRQSEGLKQGILECSQDSIKVLGLNSEILYVSPGGQRLLEIDDLDLILHKTWVDYWQGEDYKKANAAIAAATQGEVGQFQGYRATPKGTPKWWDTIITPLRNAAGDVVQLVAISRDITENKRAEMERDRLLVQEQAARAEAERANRIKDEFLAILSHELRSPLNPILGWAKLLQTRKFSPEKTAEALATIERNAKLQTQLIDDLLDVAKILRGKLVIETAPVDLVFVIESALDTVRAAAVAKSILLHPVLPAVGRVSGDSARLQQIVWNLLSNAIKFTPNHGRVEIYLEQVGDQVQMTIRDTGKGINPHFLPHLFESFQQEDASTTRKYGGLGLGLAIVRSLVEAHGGTITAESPGEGQGATFIVRLPLLDTARAIQTAPSLPSHDLNLTGIRVLAVDDEPDARELLTMLLTLYGAEVLIVHTAAEVLTALEIFQPHVLISDIGMPEMDGYGLIQQVRALPAEKGGQVPAIALTAYAREEDLQRAIASGFQWQVTKPLEPERLVKALMLLVKGDR